MYMQLPCDAYVQLVISGVHADDVGYQCIRVPDCDACNARAYATRIATRFTNNIRLQPATSANTKKC